MNIQSSVEYRKMMLETIKKDSFSSFSDKELLKYIFSFSVSPDEATKYVRKLYSTYGTLANILMVPTEELIQAGITANLAVLVRLTVLQHPVSAKESLAKGLVFDSAEKVGAFFVKLFAGLSFEKLYMLMLNDKYEFLGLAALGDGAVNNVAFQYRSIIEKAIKNNASIIILAHNHPCGDSEASNYDTTSTMAVNDYCNMAGITLGEHFVIAEDKWYPIVLFSPIMPIRFPNSFYSYQLIEQAIDESAEI